MKKVFIFGLLTLALSANAQDAVKTITVNCATPKMMAGGAKAVLTGEIDIVVSPTTGMTKVRTGSQLDLTLNGQSGKVTVQGLYFDGSSKESIQGTVDEDQSPFSELMIIFKDKKNASSSYLQMVNGKQIILECSH